MFKIPNRPRSKRYSQLSFEGFRSIGRNKFEGLFIPFTQFLRAVIKYFYRKSKLFIQVLISFGRGAYKVPSALKNLLVQKLIWSRGRLGRPIANIIVMGVAFLVFTFGEVLTGSKFVISKEAGPDYLTGATDIIPQRNVATTLVPESRKRMEPFTYTVAEGDTISGIGEKFRISVDALEYVNGLTDISVLKVGQELTIPPVSGLVHTVEGGDTLQSIAEKYDVAMQAIADFNYILDVSKLAVGTELVVPGAKVPAPVIPTPVYYAVAPTADPGASRGWCIWPTTVSIITQYFAWYHNGIDIATPWGQAMPPVYSCAGGTVTRSGWDPWGLGLVVQVDHGSGYSTLYGHLSRVDVGYGQKVKQGQTIGLMGNTGRSTGPHVHFAIKYQGTAQNPLSYL